MAQRAFRTSCWVFLGSLLIQTAWILTLAPFRGSDEYDHVYRAAEVASGHWGSDGIEAPNGRGDLVRVPAGLVEDARPMCASLKYNRPDNCRPVAAFDDGTVTIASAAARYNPVFYFVIGTPAKFFEGATSMYVMRIAGALLCSLFLAIAAWTIARWARTPWPLVSLVLVCTPVLMYSTVVAAPNGAEMCAAAGLAFALLGLSRAAERDEGTLIGVAIGFALVLTTLRTLGPLFVVCIVLLAFLHLGPRASLALAGRHRPLLCVGTVLVFAATAASLWWVVHFHTNALEPIDAKGNPFFGTLAWVPLWFLQSIAAFPLRNEPAHPAVYGAGVVVLGAALALGLFAVRRRDRRVVAAAFALSIAVPVALQTQAYSTAGVIWQGRYGWPLSLMVVALVGMALEASPLSRRTTSLLLRCGGLTWGFAHVLSIVRLAVTEQSGGIYADDPRWITASPWLIGLAAVAGLLLWAWAVAAWRSDDGPGKELPEATPAEPSDLVVDRSISVSP